MLWTVSGLTINIKKRDLRVNCKYVSNLRYVIKHT